jgi:hypothetical protein
LTIQGARNRFFVVDYAIAGARFGAALHVSQFWVICVSIKGGLAMGLRAGIGSHALQRDAYEAGAKAAAEAFAGLGGEAAALVIVFTTPQFDLQALLDGVRSVSGSTPLVGATGAGQIQRGTRMGFGGGVSVLALTAGPYRFGLASTHGVKADLEAAGQGLARASRDAAGASPHAAILLLVDNLAGNLQEFVQGVYRVTGPKVAIAGGAAGDELKFQRSFVFHDDRVIEGGAVAAWIASDRPLRVATGHGWDPIGIPSLVTRAEGTEIIELGGRPAAHVYEEQLGFAPGELGADRFWGTSIMHPFGLLQADGSSVIRVARSRTERDGLKIQGCVPPAGSAVQVMASSHDALLGVADRVAGEALAGAEAAGVLLAFSCAARAVILGDRVGEEAERLQRAAGGTPTFGLYCCGEFARTAGVLGTHNATLTALAL